MYKQEKVAKCEDCGEWYLKSEGHTCSGKDEPKESIMLDKQVLEKWGKQLFAICMKGKEWGDTKYDLNRYEKAAKISGDIKDYWSENEGGTLTIAKETISSWASDLTDIAEDGLKYSDDTYDIERYSSILEIGENLKQSLGPKSSKWNLEAVQKGDAEERDIHFISDREIVPEMIGMIERAEDQIMIASPWIWGTGGIGGIVDKLEEVHNEKGVKVRILVRRPRAGSESSHRETVRGLHKRGFQIETEDLLHAKMLIVDNSEIYIGSANLVETSASRNLEVGICTKETATVRDAVMYFENVFADAFSSRFESKS